MRIGARIRTVRKANGIKREEMAKSLSMSKADYAKLEESNDLLFSDLEKIAELIGVGVPDILSSSKEKISAISSEKKMHSDEVRLYEELLKAKDATIKSLEEQIVLLQQVKYVEVPEEPKKYFIHN